MFTILRGLSKLISTRNSFISSSNMKYESNLSPSITIKKMDTNIGWIRFRNTTRQTLIIICHIKDNVFLNSEVMTKEIDFPKDIMNNLNSYTDTELLYLTRELNDSRILQDLDINQSKQEDIKIFFKEYDAKN